MLLMITVIYIGDNLIYKTDNAVIFFQFLYLSLLSMDLRSEVRDLYRFLYGFRFMVGHVFDVKWGSMSNSELLYIEKAPTSAHFLLNVDNNILRNTGFLMIFILCYAALTLIGHIVIIILLAKSRLSKDVNHRARLNNSFIFVLENSIMIFTYFSFSNLLSESWSFS